MTSATATWREHETPDRLGPSIVEVRQYAMAPGRRDDLIALFEREFIAEQERLGMEVIDQFRDLDDPDRFVWLRGFPDMPTRAVATTAFYEEEVWQRNRDAANVTLLDHTDVLLLRPVPPAPGYPARGDRPPIRATAIPGCLVVLTVWQLRPEAEDAFPDFFAREVAPIVNEFGATILATYATEHSPNNYPRLAIREGEHVFIWLARFAGAAAYDDHRASLDRSARWTGDLAEGLTRRLDGQPVVRRLAPTARSRTR